MPNRREGDGMTGHKWARLIKIAAVVALALQILFACLTATGLLYYLMDTRYYTHFEWRFDWLSFIYTALPALTGFVPFYGLGVAVGFIADLQQQSLRILERLEQPASPYGQDMKETLANSAPPAGLDDSLEALFGGGQPDL